MTTNGLDLNIIYFLQKTGKNDKEGSSCTEHYGMVHLSTFQIIFTTCFYSSGPHYGQEAFLKELDFLFFHALYNLDR